MTPCALFCDHSATTEIYTLSLHDALPIFSLDLSPQLDHVGVDGARLHVVVVRPDLVEQIAPSDHRVDAQSRSEEHTSELQSRLHLVCRLLLEKKKQKT